jgi:VanZ like family
MTTRLARAMAWFYAAALVFLTVSSPSFRFETGMPHNLEHLAAFGLLGFLFWIGYRSHCLLVLLGGVGLTGILEALQLWAPDRHARWIDLAMNAAGFCVGVGVALVVFRSVSHLLAGRSRPLQRGSCRTCPRFIRLARKHGRRSLHSATLGIRPPPDLPARNSRSTVSCPILA